MHEENESPMKLDGLLNVKPPTPWSGEGKIPWHEPAFSGRMLREHLSQEHDLASRRREIIDRHVAWLHGHVLGGKPGRVLDLGCGPGFYASRLARLGHTCVGIDFSPASIAHARAEAEREGLACDYRLADVRGADFGSGFDLVLFVFGEFNTFSPADAKAILGKARGALSASGVLVMEVHTEEIVRSMGAQEATWFSSSQSVFSDEPHLCLKQCAWHEKHRATTQQFLVVSLKSAAVTRYVSTTQAYSEAEYAAMLAGAGFAGIEQRVSLAGEAAEGGDGLFVLVARAT